MQELPVQRSYDGHQLCIESVNCQHEYQHLWIMVFSDSQEDLEGVHSRFGLQLQVQGLRQVDNVQ